MKWPQRFYFYGSLAQIKDVHSILSAHLSHLIFLTPFRHGQDISALRAEIWIPVCQHPENLLTEENGNYQPINLPADIPV